MFTTFDNTNFVQHVLVSPSPAAIARARDIERGFFCSVSSGAARGATTNRRPPRLPHPHLLNP
jgi:hypothetical protein